MKITSLKILFVVLMLGSVSACDRVPVLETLEYVEYSASNSKQFRRLAVDTYSSKRTLEVGESGQFMVKSECRNAHEDCKARMAFRFNAPDKPGIYWMVGQTSEQHKVAFPINVIDPVEEKACLLVASFTSQGYSKVGGYNFYATPYDRPISVSLNRPIKNLNSPAHGYNFPVYDIAKRLNLELHVVDDIYLHRNKNFLQSSCQFLIFSRHSEYWTQDMLDQIKSYLKSGGDTLNMSGNIAYWLISVNDAVTEITVDKRSTQLKQNRLDRLDPEVKTLFGGYYLGYPIDRHLQDEEVYASKFPMLSQRVGLDYDRLREMTIVDPDHPVLKCINSDVKILGDEALRIELDGVLLEQHREGEEQSKVVQQYQQVSGSFLTAWTVYGKNLRNVVIGRDYLNDYGGRVLLLGSMGWTDTALTNTDIANITGAAMSSFAGREYDCLN